MWATATVLDRTRKRVLGYRACSGDYAFSRVGHQGLLQFIRVFAYWASGLVIIHTRYRVLGAKRLNKQGTYILLPFTNNQNSNDLTKVFLRLCSVGSGKGGASRPKSTKNLRPTSLG